MQLSHTTAVELAFSERRKGAMMSKMLIISVLETIRKPPLAESQTALKTTKIRRRTIFNIVVEILLPFATSTISFACYSESRSQISSKSGYPRRSNYVIYNFRMAASAAPYYFQFPI